eukprot:992438_1
MTLFLFHLFIVICTAANDITSIDIVLSPSNSSWTVETMTVETMYTTTSPTVLGTSNCSSSNPPSKIMFANPGRDALIINEIKISTASGTWYGIEGRCIDDLFMDTQYWVVDSDGYDDWFITEPLCVSGNSNIWICIDNEYDDC